MQKVVDQRRVQGRSLPEFMQYLRTDPRFRYTDPQQLCTAYVMRWRSGSTRCCRSISTTCRACPTACARSRTTPRRTRRRRTTSGPSVDGRRAGLLLRQPVQAARNGRLYEIPVLTIHEAVPGHHLQIALRAGAGRAADVPPQTPGFTAFVEGWGLYSESLGDEMGLYDRSVRQVRAADLRDVARRAARRRYRYASQAAGRVSRRSITSRPMPRRPSSTSSNEIDRYIAWPGQALAYKIGELKIKELRAQAPRRRSATSSTCASSTTSCSAAARCRSTCSRRTSSAGSGRQAK